MEILNSLGIDFGVMIAQAINFFVLLAILTLLVYKPVLRLLDERKKKILEAEKNAERIEDKLASTEELTQKELQKAQREAKKIIEQAKESAKKQEEALVADAKEKVEKIVADGRESIASERDAAAAQIQKEVSKIALLAAEKLLGREIKSADQEKFVADAMKEIEDIK